MSGESGASADGSVGVATTGDGERVCTVADDRVSVRRSAIRRGDELDVRLRITATDREGPVQATVTEPVPAAGSTTVETDGSGTACSFQVDGETVRVTERISAGETATVRYRISPMESASGAERPIADGGSCSVTSVPCYPPPFAAAVR